MFNFINVTWIFFRANSFSDAFTLLWHMCHFDWVRPNWSVWLALLGALAICVLTKNSNQLIESKIYQRKGVVALVTSILMISILVISYRNSHEFIYFQF